MHVQKGLLLLLATHHPEYPLLPHLHLRSASSMRAPLPLSQLLINTGRGPILPHKKHLSMLMVQGGTLRSSQEDSGIAALMRLLIIPQRRNNPKYMGLRTSQKRPWWNVSVSCQHLARTSDRSVHAPSLTKGRAVTLKFLPHH